jgi:hypothetical protein
MTKEKIFKCKQIQAIEFLTDVLNSGEIENFIEKISGDGFLKYATLSHLRGLYHLDNTEAADILRAFISRKKGE